MSTPMFIREPGIGAAVVLGNGAVGTLYDSVAEATLVEEVSYAGVNFSTDAGRIILTLYDGAAGIGTAYRLGSYAVAAGADDLEVTGRITVNVAIPVGWSLGASHNVYTAGHGAAANLHVQALGGILR